MDWSTVGTIVLLVLASAGGISGIFVTAIKFSSGIIAERLSKKYEMKMTKEIEAYKANVENKTFISKTKFETEFNLYRQLAKVFSLMVKDTVFLFPHFSKDCRHDYERYKSEYDNAQSSIVVAQDELYACAPFISKELYDEFYSLEMLCKNQLSDFEDLKLRQNTVISNEESIQVNKEVYKRTTTIEETMDALIETLRDYLSTLDVIE